ncbi:MAG: cytochrome D1, partial [Nitrospirota bacterium]|nr:cytochrome D1 [Nitrospirota bacterium]
PQRAAIFRAGGHQQHALIDLNRYFVLVLNDDPSISVIDPMLGMAGITKLYAQINLFAPGADWVKGDEDRALYVTMPTADQVAFVDAVRYKTKISVDAGDMPMRLMLHPDETRLWVGNDSPNADKSGVTVLDAKTGRKLKFIATGAGHHEMAFAAAGRYVFVTNRKAGTVTVIHTDTYQKVSEIATGPMPISIAHAADTGRVYVADGQTGDIAAIDTETLTVVSRVRDEPGLGPMQITPDGRFGMVLNTLADKVVVFDADSGAMRHHFGVGKRPFQLSFTENFAYVRAIETEQVTLINLGELGSESTPPTTMFGAGSAVGDWSEAITLAPSMTPAAREAASLVVNRADNTVYYYMEGMSAPMGNFRNYGHRPRAVLTVDRMLKEREAGRYSAPITLPAGGEYELILQTFEPNLTHCFPFTVISNTPETEALEARFIEPPTAVYPGGKVTVRFQIVGYETGTVHTGLSGARAMVVRLPGSGRTVVEAHVNADGVFTADLPVPFAGAYQVQVAVPELGIGFGDLIGISFMARLGP